MSDSKEGVVMEKVSDDELRLLAREDWSRVDAAPLAQEILALRSEVKRLVQLLNEARSERDSLDDALSFARRPSGG